MLAALPTLLRRGAGGRAHRVGGRCSFWGFCPLKLHDSLPYACGPRAYGARVASVLGVRIQKLQHPPRLSLRSKRKYSKLRKSTQRRCHAQDVPAPRGLHLAPRERQADGGAGPRRQIPDHRAPPHRPRRRGHRDRHRSIRGRCGVGDYPRPRHSRHRCGRYAAPPAEYAAVLRG